MPEAAGGMPLGWEILERETRRPKNRGRYVLGYRVRFDGEADSQLPWLPESLLIRFPPASPAHAHAHAHTCACTRSSATAQCCRGCVEPA